MKIVINIEKILTFFSELKMFLKYNDIFEVENIFILLESRDCRDTGCCRGWVKCREL